MMVGRFTDVLTRVERLQPPADADADRQSQSQSHQGVQFLAKGDRQCVNQDDPDDQAAVPDQAPDRVARGLHDTVPHGRLLARMRRTSSRKKALSSMSRPRKASPNPQRQRRADGLSTVVPVSRANDQAVTS